MGTCSPGGATGCYAPNSALVEVWRSVRAGGDTKTMKSRRTIALPDLCVRTLVTLRVQQDADRRTAGERWHEAGLVFTTRLGTAMDAANVRRDFRRALALVPGLKPDEWTPRAALRRGRADRRRLPARGPQQHQRDGTCLPASDPSRHPEWRDDHGSTLRFVGRPRCRGCRPPQWVKNQARPRRAR